MFKKVLSILITLCMVLALCSCGTDTSEGAKKYGYDHKDLENMVQEVNATQVAPQDRLSDHVYQYDNETHEIFRADRAEEHMQAKEEAKDTAEIPKDAVADQPKDKAEKGDKEKTSLKERLEDKKKEAKEIEKKSPEKALDKSKKKEQAL